MRSPFSSTNVSRKQRILLPLTTLFLCIGLAAAVLTMFYTNTTATVKTPDVRIGAGPDSTGGTSYPAATVTVASTYDFATVEFSLFPSATNDPQPATYYTNLLNITNYGTTSHTIESITITAINGQSNLGNITTYYYTTQTDTPSSATATGVANLTSTSTTPVTIFSGTQTIAASAAQFIEIIAYAAPGAAVNSEITFTLSLQWA